MGYLSVTPQSSVGQEVVVCFLYPSLGSSCMTGLPSYVEWLSRRMATSASYDPRPYTTQRGGGAYTIMNDVHNTLTNEVL